MDRSKNKNTQAHVDFAAPDQKMDWNTVGLDLHAQGVLRQNLRNDLLATLNQNLSTNHQATSSAVRVVQQILNSDTCHRDLLRADFESMHHDFLNVYEQADIPRQLRRRRYICPTGLAISPDHCTDTIKDIKRVYSFIKGIDAAIHRQLSELGKSQVHIVYPACGPFAPLLVPLLTFYRDQHSISPQQLNVTLIDIQQGAVMGLQALIQHLGLDAYINQVVCTNALDYVAQQPVDIVVLEALQHGFSREGHLCLAKHFADMLVADGVFLPQEIKISAALNIGQREFVEQWNPDIAEDVIRETQQAVRQERILLGEILRVNLPMLRNMKVTQQDEYTSLYECQEVNIPDLESDQEKQVLLIQTEINVFGPWGIGEYESGITHPLPDLKVCINFTPRIPEPDDLLVNSGDKLKFYYCMNGLPGFLPIRLEGSNAPAANTQLQQAGEHV